MSYLVVKNQIVAKMGQSAIECNAIQYSIEKL